MRKVYPSDISREQFERIKPLLESARKKTKPRVIDLYEVFCGLQYVLKSGCQWQMLPSVLEQVLKKLLEEIRVDDGREKKTSFGIVDAQSVKNTDTAPEKRFQALNVILR